MESPLEIWIWRFRSKQVMTRHKITHLYLLSFSAMESDDQTSSKREDEVKAEVTSHHMPTAFVKPTPQVPSVVRPTNYQFSNNDQPRFHNTQHSGITLSPIKHLSPVNGSAFERSAPYMQHISIATFPEYLNGTGNTFTNPCMTTMVDNSTQNLASTPYAGSGFSVPNTNTSAYWNDSRTLPGLSADPYSTYVGYNKYPGSYEPYGRHNAILRSGAYQDNFGSCRSAFDPATRGLYGRPHDNFTGIHTYTYIHTYIYTYIHIYIHTYIHSMCLYIIITIMLWVLSIYHFIKHYTIVILCSTIQLSHIYNNSIFNMVNITF